MVCWCFVDAYWISFYDNIWYPGVWSYGSQQNLPDTTALLEDSKSEHLFAAPCQCKTGTSLLPILFQTVDPGFTMLAMVPLARKKGLHTRWFRSHKSNSTYDTTCQLSILFQNLDARFVFLTMVPLTRIAFIGLHDRWWRVDLQTHRFLGLLTILAYIIYMRNLTKFEP